MELRITGSIYKDEKSSYLDFIKKNRLSRKVFFLGPINHKEISKRYNEIDILVLPTISDGCPNVIFEGMFLGKAIISTNNSAITQIIKNKKEALLVNQRSSQELAIAIKKLVNNPSLIKRLGAIAKKKLQQFKPENEASAYEKIYYRLQKQ